MSYAETLSLADPHVDVDLELRYPLLSYRGLKVYPPALRVWVAYLETLVEPAGAVDYPLAKLLWVVGRGQEDNLVDVDIRDINLTREKIKKQYLLFNISDTKIEPGHMDILDDLVTDMSKLFKLGRVIDKRVRIEIVGHADASGSEKVNMEISAKRAKNALSVLVTKGLNAENFTVFGVGSSEPVREEITELDRKFNRSVRFRIIIADN